MLKHTESEEPARPNLRLENHKGEQEHTAAEAESESINSEATQEEQKPETQKDITVRDSTSSTAKEGKVIYVGNKRGLGKGALIGSVGTAGVLFVANVDWKAWNALVLEAAKAFLHENGPTPFLVSFFFLVILYLLINSYKEQIAQRDKELDRVVKEKQALQERLDAHYPSSKINKKAK